MKKYILILFLLTGCYSVKQITQTPVDFGYPYYIYDLAKANVSENEFYADHTVTLSQNTEVKGTELYLYAKPYNKYHHFWNGEKYCTWSTGWVDFKGINSQKYGTWEAEITMPTSKDEWPAFWILHDRHPAVETMIPYKIDTVKEDNFIIPINDLFSYGRIDYNWCVYYEGQHLGYIAGYDSTHIRLDRYLIQDIDSVIYICPDHITPEIDVMENIRGRIEHNLHWGYSRDKYSLHKETKRLFKPQCRKYSFAVTITPWGYTFYVDRIKTFEIAKKDAVADWTCYPILNNAKAKEADGGDGTVMIVHSLKYYKQ